MHPSRPLLSRRGRGLRLLLALLLLLALASVLGCLARPRAVWPTGAFTFGYAPAAVPPWAVPARTMIALVVTSFTLWGASLMLGGERGLGPAAAVSVLGRYSLLPIIGLFALPVVRRGLAHLVVVEHGHLVATGARTTLPWVGVGLVLLYVFAAVMHLRLFREGCSLSGGRAVLGSLLGFAAAEALCRGVFAMW